MCCGDSVRLTTSYAFLHVLTEHELASYQYTGFNAGAVGNLCIFAYVSLLMYLCLCIKT